MNKSQKTSIKNEEVLSKALLNAGKNMGLSQMEIGAVIGKDRSSIQRGIDPASKSGELALLVIRCYRSLYVLVGGKPEDMKHWMKTPNNHFSDMTPIEKIKSITGLSYVVEYLDAMRGKV